jgi:hypothetical protein
MNKSIKFISATGLGVALLLGTGASAWALSNPAISPAPTASVSWDAVAPSSGTAFKPVTPAGSTSASPKLIGLVDWSQCYVLNNETWKIQSFSTTYLGAKKTLSIQCGTQATQGYFHIALPVSGRQQEWRNRITQAQPGANTDGWDDWMWWLAIQTWNAPEVSVNQGNGKVCRSAPIQMYGTSSTGARVLKYTFRPSFVWSITQDRLITAIPSTNSTC